MRSSPGSTDDLDRHSAPVTIRSIYAKPIRHASYLLVSDASAIKSFQICDEPAVSDHWPLVVDI